MPGGLLGIEPLDRVEIEGILDRAKRFQPRQTDSKKSDQLRGRMIVNLFFEASTRTRTSFEIAAKRLGADIISITAQASSVTKGESLVDTLNTLAGGAGQPVHALYATTQFWNLDGAPATDWTLNWAHGLIENAPHPKHG